MGRIYGESGPAYVAFRLQMLLVGARGGIGAMRQRRVTSTRWMVPSRNVPGR